MMKNFATAILVLFMILLSTQFIRHVYVKVFYNQESVLDKYSKKSADLPFDKTASLKELSLIYADADKRVKIFEKEKSAKVLAKYDNTDEPYNKKVKLEEIITKREADNRMVMEIIFFWITGLILTAAGSFIYLKYEIWIGISLIVSGLIEMTCKLGPVFFMTIEKPESLMILNIKLVFAAVTLAALITYWFFGRKYLNR